MPSSPTPSPVIRAATPNDLPFQAALYASLHGRCVEEQFDDQRHHYEQCYPQAAWFIVECGGQRVGRLILDRAEDHVHILDIALVADYRGQGIGSRILRDVIAEAEARRVPVRLFAFNHERALSLYHRLGFADVNDDGTHTELIWEPGLGA